MDTFNGTTTKGTIVENSTSAVNAYVEAFNGLSELLLIMKQFSKNIVVSFIPGNHDRLSSFHLLHSLSKCFTDACYKFDVNYAERKVYQYGKNMFCFEHGDVNYKNNPLLYAVENPTIWGNTIHRTLYMGHHHGKKAKEYITQEETLGFVTRVLPALTTSDYYHYHNKWVENARSAILHMHDAEKGDVGELVFTVKKS